MRTAIRVGCVCVTVIAMATAVSHASATTLLYVNHTGGSDANACTSPAAPCKTIAAALAKSEVAPEAATINVAPGTYQEELKLSHPADDGLTITGAGSGLGATEIEGPASAGGPTVDVTLPGIAVGLANLSIVNPGTDTQAGASNVGELTLENVAFTMEGSGTASAITCVEAGTVAFEGGSVTMEAGGGTAISTSLCPTTLSGVTVLVLGAASGGGITGEFSPITLSNVAVVLGSSALHPAISAAGAAAAVNGLSVTVNNKESAGIELQLATATVSNAHVSMNSEANTNPGLFSELGSAALEDVTIGGTWKGVPAEGDGGTLTVRGSTFTDGATDTNPAVAFVGSNEGPGLLVQRSVMHATTTAIPASLVVIGANATIDSSEVLGGDAAVESENSAGKTRTLTIASSTLDAGVLGVRDAGAFGVDVAATSAGSIANANIEGSIVLEPQVAAIGAGVAATVDCSYSDVPGQTQAAKGTEGTVSCADGSTGNTTTSPLTALFAEPFSSYALSPSSPALDSVPAGAIALPFGETPSATDLAGNQRVVNGTGGCAAVEDRGALELQGHAGSCGGPSTAGAAGVPPGLPKVPPSPRPAISGLALSPREFLAAQSGAAVSRANHPRQLFGTVITYRDSTAATTTFTVLGERSGRMQGKSCRKPGAANRRGRSCTLYVKLGGFAHVDLAGANRLRFSGRLKGSKLPTGSYRLQAVPRNSAGSGGTVTVSFKIKGPATH